MAVGNRKYKVMKLRKVRYHLGEADVFYGNCGSYSI